MIPPESRTRSYYHHFIRLSYVLPDLGMITKPCLNIVDAHRAVASWRRTACDQGLVYREEQKRLLDEYRGDFIYLQDGSVVWNGPEPTNLGSRRKLSGDKKDSALWLKYVDPEEREGERFEVYEEFQRLAS